MRSHKLGQFSLPEMNMKVGRCVDGDLVHFCAMLSTVDLKADRSRAKKKRHPLKLMEVLVLPFTCTTMSSPPASPTQPYRPTKDDIAAAAIARISSSAEDDEEYEKQWAQDKERRQHFRRLVDPGIVRPNNEACLLTLCQNIIDHPDEDKYRRFKLNNKTIQTKIIQAKGGLEYAVEVGFREHVEDFQPFYVWRPSPDNDAKLRVGTFVLKEHHEKIVAKEDAAKQSKMSQKEAAELVARKVKMQFEEDRRAMAAKQRMEVERRIALESLPQRPHRPTPAAALGPGSPQGNRLEDDFKED
ncbi:hypothetical protein FRC01_001308 [Tulasnella sp. 417]|nr:hypothetical protein FRC01_001308 [Tulasnella sp. 417]